MLYLVHRESKKTTGFYIIDSHHHLGEDEDGMEAKPVGANGSYSFCKKVLHGDGSTEGLINRMREGSDDYNWVIPEKNFVRPHPLIERTLYKKKDDVDTYAIDQIVVFPMHDIFRERGKIIYGASNNYVENWVNTIPHSRRLIGFGRIDPNEDMTKNLEEIERMVFKGGLKGLKLHPQSDEFNISDNRVKSILKKACELNIPVIFHTSYGSEVQKLHEMCNEILADYFEDDQAYLIRNFRILIGHCTYQSEKVFDALSHPCIYGELSTLNNPSKYFEILRDKVNPGRFFDTTLPFLNDLNSAIDKDVVTDIFGLRSTFFEWHHKVMIGTDNPYMPFVKLVDLLKDLFSKDLDLDTREIQNILSGNILRIFSSDLIFKTEKNTIFPRPVSLSEDMEIVSIFPVVEPNIISGIDLNSSFLKVKENDEDLGLIHKKYSLTPLEDGKSDYEQEIFINLCKYERQSEILAREDIPILKPSDPIEKCEINSLFYRLYNER